MSGSESEALNVSQLPHISRERRRGTPWTEEEHRAFLAGLDKLGKGDWRGISKDYVTTRTPTQVASHAQKYFIRHNNQSKRKRRTSLFDLKADAEVLETGSAEATSAAWPERTLQHSSSVSGHGHTLPGPPQLASGVVDRSSLPSAHQSNAAPFASHMWLPAGPDMAFMQHYMQMAAGQVDPAVLQMAQYQMAAAHGLNFPGFPGFPPPGIAEQDDPAFGNGRLYRPQASHAKPSVAPPSTKFGGAINDNPQSGSLLSTNSSSESVLPPAGCCFEGAGKHTAPLQS
ncbi:hypothetical protein WJX82_005510 [Trebouxia sp. C0006]